MATMKFKNVLQLPVQGSEDGMYYVKKGDKFEYVLVSGGTPYAQNKVIAEYVHSGNLEVRVESADFETNTFYSPNHGLVDGDRLSINIDLNNVSYAIPFLTLLPIKDMITQGLHVINKTLDTFQLSITANGQPISLINEDTANFSIFWFEIAKPIEIIFKYLDENSVRIVAEGCFSNYKPIQWINYNKNTRIGGRGYIKNGSYNTNTGLLISGQSYSIGGRCITDIILHKESGMATYSRDYASLQFGETDNVAMIKDYQEQFISQGNLKNSNIESITFALYFSPLNGSTIKIYKK